MDLKTTILGLVALAAIAAAVFLYINPLNQPAPDVSPSPNAVVSSSPTPVSSHISTESPVPSSSPTIAANRTFTENQALSQPSTVETINAGEGLSTIANAHSVAVAELAALNMITDVNKVFAGQKVIVPDDASDASIVLLFVPNPARQKKEEAKITAGSASIYTDAISAAQADAKNLYSLKSDTPYSKTNETDIAVTLSTTDQDRTFSLTMEKTSSLWFIKKLTVKTVPAPKATI